MKGVRYISILCLISFLDIKAQNDMLIEQLSDRLVIRENFDKNGALLNIQTFEVGKIKELEGYYEIDVITELFDENRKSTDKYTTTYRCKPNESIVMVMVIPFADPKSRQTQINSNSKNFKKLYELENLEDIEIEISFDSSLLDFFGSKSKIRIYDRILDSNENVKIIKSKINIKAYVLGIRLRNLEYKVIEKFTDKGLLSFQEFTEEDGSYFTITYN